MKTLGIFTVALVFTVAVPQPQAAPVDGTFIAEKACPAFQSKNKRTNPGGVTTEPSRRYEALEINDGARDFIRVRIPGAPSMEERWVSITCGRHVASGTTPRPQRPAQPTPPRRTAPPARASRESTRNLLTVSWQPAFCERAPRETECKRLNRGRLRSAETQFSLHGLWPQPNGNFYCGRLGKAHKAADEARHWHRLPEPDLSAQTRAALDSAMPGHLSHLDRHEWIKHGTCYFGAGGAEEYYADTLHLMDQLNRSKVRTLLAGRIGRHVSGVAIRQAFDDAFGRGAGARVEINCETDRDSGRRLISELWINLEGPITPDVRLGDLIRAARAVSPGCRGGIVDPAGNQR